MLCVSLQWLMTLVLLLRQSMQNSDTWHRTVQNQNGVEHEVRLRGSLTRFAHEVRLRGLLTTDTCVQASLCVHLLLLVTINLDRTDMIGTELYGNPDMIVHVRVLHVRVLIPVAWTIWRFLNLWHLLLPSLLLLTAVGHDCVVWHTSKGDNHWVPAVWLVVCLLVLLIIVQCRYLLDVLIMFTYSLLFVMIKRITCVQ